MSNEVEQRVLTMTDKRNLEEELKKLRQEKLDVAEEIKIARGHGDLSENAEYDEAKNNEARIYTRLAEVENTLKTAVFVDDSTMSTDTVALGLQREGIGTVKLKDLSVQQSGHDFNVMYQATLMVAKYAMGHGILRPACAIEISKAAATASASDSGEASGSGGGSGEDSGS